MFELVYSSVATRPFTPAELRALLDHSRPSNLAAGITGILLYKNGSFLQVLEGEEAIVKAAFARIAGDRRHDRVRIVRQGEQPQRSFGAWSMGFVSLDPKLAVSALGGHALSSNGTLADESDVGALLDRFRNGEWSGWIG